MRCPECNGTGAVDSGGSTPWGVFIMIPCSFCAGTGSYQFWDLPSVMEDLVIELESI